MRDTEVFDPEQPFGVLRGPYRTNGVFSSFSGSAYADLRRRGFSVEEIQGFIDNGIPTSTDRTPRPTLIRETEPRSVVIERPVDTLPPEDQTRVRGFQAIIDAAERERAVRIEQLEETGTLLGTDAEILRLDNTIELNESRISALRRVEIDGLDLTIDANNSEVADNPLNCYTDVQYHVSLTMLSQDKVLEFQLNGFRAGEGVSNSIDIDAMRVNPRVDGSVTFASTGDIFSNTSTVSQSANPDGIDATKILFKRNFYTINSTVVKNIMEPSLSNPLVSTMLSMKMRIAEPHGFKLHEDIRSMAHDLGYVDINPGRVVYRIDTYFSGYKQDTGEWVEQIDISAGRGINVLSNVMCISAIEAEITSAGTVYEVDFVPMGHHAYRPEDFVLDGTSIQSGINLREFLVNFSKALKTTKENRVNGRLIRNYEFFAPKLLLDSPFDISAFKKQHLYLFRNTGDHVTTSGKDMDIMSILRGALANTTFIQDLFLADSANANFNIPRIHFATRFNTIYGDANGAINADPTLNDYKEITHQYILEPFVSFKHGTVTPETINAYVDPESQLGRIKEIIRFGMLRRVYDYIYTPDNTEVIDFEIKLKAFYYETLNTPNQQGVNQQHTSESASDITTRVNGLRELINIQGIGIDDENVESTIRRLFGDIQATDAADASGTRSLRGANRLGGGFNESPDSRLYGDVTGDEGKRRGDYETYMNDYLTLDLLKLNGMQVRGDPVWLMSPYASHDVDNIGSLRSTEGVGSTSAGSSLLVKPRTGQVIFLRMFAPEQDDHMNPDRTSGSAYPNIIGGFYQILDVTSTFENGKFTQTVEGVKMNHLNYAEALFERSAARRPQTDPRGDMLREPTTQPTAVAPASDPTVAARLARLEELRNESAADLAEIDRLNADTRAQIEARRRLGGS